MKSLLFLLGFVSFLTLANENEECPTEQHIENLLSDLVEDDFVWLTGIRKTTFEEGALKSVEIIDLRLLGNVQSLLMPELVHKIDQKHLSALNELLGPNTYYPLTWSNSSIELVKEKLVSIEVSLAQ